MRKFAAVLFIMLTSLSINAQQTADEQEVREVIERFFEGFHARDSIVMKSVFIDAWTPYSFFLNDTFSHCGVNNFQLLKKEGEWKIIYLIDTRRKEGCEMKKLK